MRFDEGVLEEVVIQLVRDAGSALEPITPVGELLSIRESSKQVILEVE